MTRSSTEGDNMHFAGWADHPLSLQRCCPVEECWETDEAASCATRCGEGADKDGETTLQAHVSSFLLQVEKKVPKKLYNPIKTVPPLIVEKPSNFFKQVNEAKEVGKAFVALSTCMHGLKLELGEFKNIWMKYSEIWTVDRMQFIEEMEVEI